MKSPEPRSPPSIPLDFLLSPDQYYPIYTSLHSFLRIEEMVTLTKTCKKLSTLAQQIPFDNQNFCCAVQYYVGDLRGFIAQVKQHGALISCDKPFRFFNMNRTSLIPMDVFFNIGYDHPNNSTNNTFIEYLSKEEGYEESDRSETARTRRSPAWRVCEVK